MVLRSLKVIPLCPFLYAREGCTPPGSSWGELHPTQAEGEGGGDPGSALGSPFPISQGIFPVPLRGGARGTSSASGG